jgi:hypothetical protein
VGWDTTSVFLQKTILCTRRWPLLPVRDDILVLHADAPEGGRMGALIRAWLQGIGVELPNQGAAAQRAAQAWHDLKHLPLNRGAKNVVLVVHHSERLDAVVLARMKAVRETWDWTPVVATVVLEGDLAVLEPRLGGIDELRGRYDIVPEFVLLD